MKKLVLTAFALTTAVGVFAQGTVIFNNRLGSTTHVYGGGTTTSEAMRQMIIPQVAPAMLDLP